MALGTQWGEGFAVGGSWGYPGRVPWYGKQLNFKNGACMMELVWLRVLLCSSPVQRRPHVIKL
jgi:hypothetical protein